MYVFVQKKSIREGTTFCKSQQVKVKPRRNSLPSLQKPWQDQSAAGLSCEVSPACSQSGRVSFLPVSFCLRLGLHSPLLARTFQPGQMANVLFCAKVKIGRWATYLHCLSNGNSRNPLMTSTSAGSCGD